MKSIYLETSIVGYLTSWPSRDLIVAAHQQRTHEWWHQQRKNYLLHISSFVLREASAGDAEAATERLAILQGIPELAVTEEAESLARALLGRRILPEKASIDALHLAIAVVHEMDILLTWNCRHLANASILVEVGRFIRMKGYEMPVVCTPDGLSGDEGKIHD